MTQRLALLIAEQAALVLVARAKAAHPNEAGGILIGLRSSRGIHVSDALEVPQACPRPSRYSSSAETRESVLAAWVAGQPASPLGYVGMWHSHPVDQGHSLLDRRTLRREAVRAPDWVASLVVRSLRNDEWSFDALIGTRRRSLRVEIETVSGSTQG